MDHKNLSTILYKALLNIIDGKGATVKPIIITLLLISRISRLVMVMRILLALIYVQNSITMPHLALMQLMRVIKWPRLDSGGSCVNKNVRGNKRFYSISNTKYHYYYTIGDTDRSPEI